MDDEVAWGPDPTLPWNERFHKGDVVRLDDGRLAVVQMVLDYAPEPPSKWELLVTALMRPGVPDDFIAEPWVADPAPDARPEALALGLLR